MAKATKATNTPPASTPATAAAPGATAAAPAKEPVNDLFVRVFQTDGEGKIVEKDGKPVAVAPTTKLAPQAVVLLNAIEAAGPDGIRRADLVKNVTGVLITRQPPGRILSYYQKELVNSGAVKRSNPAPVAAAPATPAAPASAPAA